MRIRHKRKNLNNKRTSDLCLTGYNIHCTKHFYQRIQERTNSCFSSYKEFQEYFSTKYADITLEGLSGRYYMLGDYLVVASINEKTNTITFITTYGHIDDCYMAYNIIKYEGALAFQKTVSYYGKICIWQNDEEEAYEKEYKFA